MAAQVSTNYANLPILRTGEPYTKDNETLEQDAGRATALAQYTVMAQKASTRKWVPLTTVDPTLTKGKMVCGAAGTAEAGFQAVSDGSFQVTVDGVAMSLTGLDFSGIEAPTRTHGFMTCGALGTDESGFQAVSDGSFQVTVDGVALSLTGLDFSNIKAVSDTSATGVCGALGTNLAGFQAVVDGAFNITVDGAVIAITGLDWSAITALDEVVDPINAAAAGRFLAVYDSQATVVTFFSLKTGSISTLSALSAPGAGTDVSGAGFLNGAAGTITLTQGVGGDDSGVNIQSVIEDGLAGRASVLYDGARIVIVSQKWGATSSVSVLTAGAAGTDISGAGFLNGLTGTGVVTAGTGDDGTDRNIADVINDAAAGRFFVTYDGSRVAFYSPTVGVQSSVSVLAAGAAGTDISGAGFLNGLTGTGTATAGTGNDGSDIPSGILWSDSVAAASLVAGDVTGQVIMVGGSGAVLDVSQVVLESSLTVNSVVVARGETVESVLRNKGIFLNATRDISSYQA